MSHAVTVSWTATGKLVQVDGSHSSSDGEFKSTVKTSSDFRPAVAIGTFDGEDMGESTWAQIIDREERPIVNGNGRSMAYFPPWAITPADADKKVAAEWDTCEYAVRDGIDVDEPDPGDICVWTQVTAYKPSASADNAAAVGAAADASVRRDGADPGELVGESGPGRPHSGLPPEHRHRHRRGRFRGMLRNSNPRVREGHTPDLGKLQAVQQPVRLDTEQFRPSTATGTIDGEAIPGIESRWAVIGGPLPGKSGR